MKCKILHIVFVFALVISCSSDNNTFVETMISDDELLEKIQEDTFQYFWNGAHQQSGMALERSNGSDVIVTTGGTGFGILSIIVGAHRNFITREAALQRILKITNFLIDAERFHGAFAHWYNGNTGQVIPFSSMDNGGDLVETSFLIQGLLTAKQYFSHENSDETLLRNNIDAIWNSVEWNWYVQPNRSYLTWHWSPDFGFQQDHKISGYNEALITYILAASSPTHPIQASTYHEGWANNGAIINGNTYYNHMLSVGEDYGGPLFFSHYSFLALDPRGLEDVYANYWDQNTAHTKINRAYCIDNPKEFIGYGPSLWGLTASDNHQGYNAHSPTNDLGVISPTAALSSMPYTPQESISFLRNLYENRPELWGRYGLYDAFNDTENWVAQSYLAIDQGPIIVMIENYRSQLLWNYFMQNQDVLNGLTTLGFTSPHL